MKERKPPKRFIMQRKTAVSAIVVLSLLSAAGGGLIIWWAIAFHRSNDQPWMVPFGLVLAGTPIVAWVSVLASDLNRRSQLLLPADNPNADPAPVNTEIGDEG